MSDISDKENGSDQPRFGLYLRHRGEALAASAREAGFFAHRPTSGTAREEVLRKPLQQFLPNRYSVTSGEVIASDGASSSQWDVLIYNTLDTPVLHSAVGSAILPIEGTLAAISVRSVIDKAAVDDVAAAAAQLRAMPRQSLPTVPRSVGPVPAVFLFGFQGADLKTLRQHVARECSGGAASPSVLSGVCVLKSGLVVPVNDAGDVDLITMTGYRIALSREGAWGFFVALLWTALIFQPVAAPNLLTYLRPGQLLDPSES